MAGGRACWRLVWQAGFSAWKGVAVSDLEPGADEPGQCPPVFSGELARPGAAVAARPDQRTVIVPGLGPLESAIMTVIWDAGEPLTVRGVRDRMDYRGMYDEDPAYTTVMTVMTVLWRKGLLSRDRFLGEGNRKAWWYQARVTREDHLAGVIGGVLACAPDPAAVLLRALPPASGSPRVCLVQVASGVYVLADMPAR